MHERSVSAMIDVLRRIIATGLLLVLPLALSIQGCDSDNGPEPPERVVVTPATASLTWIGETVQLTGEVVDKNGNAIGGAGIASWSSSATNICTVNSQGVVTAAGAGTCTVTASSNTDQVVTGTAEVTVSQEATALSWEVQPAGALAGETLGTSTVCMQDAGGADVTGDNSTQITVAIDTDPSGGTAELSGTNTKTVSSGCADFDDLIIDIEGNGYTLVASATGLSDEASSAINVGANPTSVTVSCPDGTLESLGETAQCTAQVWSDGRELSNVPLTWEANPTSVCTVDNSGLVTAQGPGDCTVTATETLNDNFGSDVVTVQPTAAQLSFQVQPTDGKAEDVLSTFTVCAQDAGGTVLIGDNSTQVVIAIGANPSGGTLSGTTSKTVVSGCADFDDLSIDIEGDGYTLTADDANGLSAATSAAFKMARNVAAAVVTCPDLLQSIGETGQCTAEAQSPAGRVIPNPDLAGDAIGFAWDSDPTSVCTVDANGVVTAVDSGACTVSATADGISGSDMLTVQPTAAQLAFQVQPNGGKAEDALSTFTVCTQDAGGTTVTDDNSTQVTIAIGTNPSGGTLTGTIPRTVSSGCVDFDDLSIDVEADGYTLTADDENGLTAATSAAFTVTRNIATVIVTCPDAPLESIGETTQCGAEARSPAGRVIPDPDLAGDALAFTWGPADPATVCSVDNTGLVTALAAGTCTVPAQADEVSGSDVVTVDPKPASISIVPPEFAVLAIGEQTTLTVEAEDALGNPIVSPTVAVQCAPGGVVDAAGLDLTGAAAGVADCEVSSDAAADTARIAVVEQEGFAATFTTDTDLYRMTATAGGDIQVDFWMIRPSGGDGDLGSIQGSLTWDASVLTYVSSAAVESGWTWVPNETNVGTGTLGYAAFSATGTASTFVVARVTFTPAAGSTDLDLSVTAAGDALGTNITAFVEAVGTSVWVQ